MKRLITVLLAVLVAGVPVAAIASVSATYYSAGSWVHYLYTYTNTEEPTDVITAFHVYSPADLLSISGSNADEGWEFTAGVDEISGCSDLFWTAVSAPGLSFGDSVSVELVTPATVAVVEDYVLPDFPLGNWGYETESWPGFGVFVMMPSVPVPGPSPVAAPEPCSILALALGCVGLATTRRRR